MAPAQLVPHIEKGAEALSLDTCSAFEAASIKTASEPIKLKAPVLVAPVISYNNNRDQAFDHIRTDWKTGNTRYLRSPESPCWAFYVVCRGGPVRDFDSE